MPRSELRLFVSSHGASGRAVRDTLSNNRNSEPSLHTLHSTILNSLFDITSNSAERNELSSP